jgi:hypothetical protein
MKLGRSPNMRIEDSRMDLPLDVDDQFITDESVQATQPSAIPSKISFFLSTIKFAPLIHEMLVKLYIHDHGSQDEDGRGSYMLCTIISLESKLRAWQKRVPGHLWPDSQGQNDVRSEIRSQRSSLRMRYVANFINGSSNIDVARGICIYDC